MVMFFQKHPLFFWKCQMFLEKQQEFPEASFTISKSKYKNEYKRASIIIG